MTRGPAIEGGFASPNPRMSTVAGVDELVGGGPYGAAVGRFGWADVQGRVRSLRNAGTDRLGFVVLPSWNGVQPGNGWLYAYRDEVKGALFIRPGLNLTMASRGDFWARFPGGAVRGASVYADPLDGSCISGYAEGAELTPWNVVNSAAPGQLAIISTWSDFPA